MKKLLTITFATMFLTGISTFAIDFMGSPSALDMEFAPVYMQKLEQEMQRDLEEKENPERAQIRWFSKFKKNNKHINVEQPQIQQNNRVIIKSY